MPQENPRRALGKGLGALLPTRLSAVPAALPSSITPSTEGTRRIAIDQIDPNPMQPRRVFQADALQQLAQSILHSGIIQPLVVRPRAANQSTGRQVGGRDDTGVLLRNEHRSASRERE